MYAIVYNVETIVPRGPRTGRSKAEVRAAECVCRPGNTRAGTFDHGGIASSVRSLR